MTPACSCALRRPCRREAELRDGEEELTATSERALLLLPRGCIFGRHSALIDDVPLEHRHERATIGVRDQFVGREHMALHSDVLEAGLVELGRECARQRRVDEVLVERGKLDQAQPLLEQARSIFREHYTKHPELMARAENALGAVQLSRRDYREAESLLLPLADQFLIPTANISPNERREAIGHIVQLYQAWGKPDQAALWQQKLDELATPRAPVRTQ